MASPAKKTKESKEEPDIKVESVDETPLKKEDDAKEEVVTVKTNPSASKKIDEEKDAEIVGTPLKKDDEKSSDSDDLKTESKSANVTSFSLIDSDKSPKSESATEKPDVELSSDASEKPKGSAEEVNKWIENYNEPEPTAEPKKERSFFKIFLIVLLILSLVAAIAGGVIYYQKNMSTKITIENENEPKPVEITEVPTPTPEEESDTKDYSKYSLRILNGSGVPGEAGVAKDLISDYEFGSVTTGNAENYDYEDTEIYVKEDLPKSVFEDLSEALSGKFTVASKANDLDEDSDYDVEIIVGVRK